LESWVRCQIVQPVTKGVAKEIVGIRYQATEDEVGRHGACCSENKMCELAIAL
jgi:hypothetical protein